ncbi:hypothetical protein TPHA_0E02010 [Tetrapisispora phaffii CBS 4417]|uniref:Pre-mRNA-splicing factor Syf1/CRNKL1-like C-terminal HAT-repeats domain-containing protein n=1 Tax=Tetrapisispora phaffii (strain ATCC 24235 / CBS 4417 / NBRC 1672 / NRRL Y-8282 / UCD 70-5) TaxID=1071381 RepID=G8BTR5_TETPH|nr:hypothetical protein TPHA_0E02010 [Tetrapisispora phaffii CBS 4417]CCE63293.1 hypothetical protein TPHA_0E02010 [Tetrapisispora phaffii CBS 4417]
MDNFIKDDDDIAYEYELQKDPNNRLTWERYINKKKNESDIDKTNIIWLYERCCLQLSETDIIECLNIYSVFFNYLILEIDFKDCKYLVENLFINKLLKYYKNSKYSKKKIIVFEKICFELLNFCISRNEIQYIHILVNEFLKSTIGNNNSIESHRKLWTLLLEYIKLILNSDDRQEIIDIDNGNVTLNNEEVAIIGILRDNIGNHDHEETKEVYSNLFASDLIERYLIVCPKSNLNYILELLFKTNDYPKIKSAYEKYLLIDKNFNKKIPLKLKLNYLLSLEKCNLVESYEKYILQLLNSELDSENEEFTIITIFCKFFIKHKKIEQLNSFINDTLSLENKPKTASPNLYVKLYDYFINVEKNIIDIYIEQQLENRSLITNQLNFFKQLLYSKDLKINDLKIAKNENQVINWLERLNIVDSNKYKIYSDQQIVLKKAEIYNEAIVRIDPASSSLLPGSFSKIWISYATFYWDLKQYDTAKELYERSVKVPFKYLQDLEAIWLSWVKHIISLKGNENMKAAIKILESALSTSGNPEAVYENFMKNYKLNLKPRIPAQAILFSSKKLWNYYLDLVESSNNLYSDAAYVEKIMSIYEKMIELKVATPINFISYAEFLSRDKILAAFQIYERAIAIFPPTTKYLIWTAYLTKTLENKSLLSTEHIRELFAESIRMMNENSIECSTLYTMFSDFEEIENKMYTRSVNILIEGILQSVKKKTKINTILKLWDLVIMKTKSLLGLIHLRPIYEQCIQLLPNSVVTKYIIDFSKLELQLTEVVRARQILHFGSQLLPPAKNTELWNFWEEMEIKYGTKEKYKDMLKLKKKLEEEMFTDTAAVTKAEGRIEFVASSTSKDDVERVINPDELELDL